MVTVSHYSAMVLLKPTENPYSNMHYDIFQVLMKQAPFESSFDGVSIDRVVEEIQGS